MVLVLSSYYFTFYFLQPTPTEVTNFLKENGCVGAPGELEEDYYYCGRHLSRSTTLIFGNIYEIPWWFLPKIVLWFHSPFHPITYYDMNDPEKDRVYVFVKTSQKEYTVYDPYNGNYITKSIGSSANEVAWEYYRRTSKIMDNRYDQMKQQVISSK